MRKCAWPTCNRYQKEEYCFPHSRGNAPQSNSKPQQSVSIPGLLERAQKEFNRFIRDRDRAYGCFTCGSSGTEAGHFIPVGENAALRFEEDNCHLQCTFCNVAKRGNRSIYRAVMVQKYGEARVRELETAPRFNKWSREQLQAIIDQYSLTPAK